MPYLSQQWFNSLLSVLQQMEGNISTLQTKVDKMSQAQDAFRAAFTSYQNDVKAKLSDLKSAIDAAVQAQQSGDDAAFQQATNEINAAHDELTAQVNTTPPTPAAQSSAPTTDQTSGTAS